MKTEFEHFRWLLSLEDRFKELKCEFLEHSIHWNIFGSWFIVLRKSGIIFRIVWDGKERHIELEKATKFNKWIVVTHLRLNNGNYNDKIDEILNSLVVST